MLDYNGFGKHTRFYFLLLFDRLGLGDSVCISCDVPFMVMWSEEKMDCVSSGNGSAEKTPLLEAPINFCAKKGRRVNRTSFCHK